MSSPAKRGASGWTDARAGARILAAMNGSTLVAILVGGAWADELPGPERARPGAAHAADRLIRGWAERRTLPHIIPVR